MTQRKKTADKQKVTPSGSENLPSPKTSRPFAIAGIGASAGGMEALDQFLRYVPQKSGIAYVIVQHLDPTHKGMLPEILRSATSMPVVQAEDRMLVKPDSVYVIPPNKDMSILHGRLHLFEPAAPRGLRLPIDYFLRSLADDCKERSIGIILSGMGSDGTMGLRAIRENSGLAAVQDPESAKFDSMPRSAINAGLADIVAPTDQLPVRIIDYHRYVTSHESSAPLLDDKEQSSLEKIAILLRTKTGHDFSDYKKTTISRRIERRMGIHQLGKINDYIRFLRENPQEIELLFKELLIGVTSFFRDPEEWELLKADVMPWFLAERPATGVVRAWCAGCSTGEEAYSLAIIFAEMLEQLRPKERYTLQIFATDLDPDAIARARQGHYPANIAADVSAERLNRFFIAEENSYQICKEIREMVTFATQNVIMDPPFTRLNLVVCRNLLIYLNADLQRKLLPLFHYSLIPEGVLFLGSAESIGSFTDLFMTLHPKSRLFRKRKSSQPVEPVDFPAGFAHHPLDISKDLTMHKPKANLQSLTDQLILRNHTSPAVLVNEQGDILCINGRTGQYLEPAAGKANWNIFVMAREGLRFELTGGLKKAVVKKEAIKINGLTVEALGRTQRVDVLIQPLSSPEELAGMVLIVFNAVAALPTTKAQGRSKEAGAEVARIAELELELNRSHEELQAAREVMQSSQEELKSTNEELQSTNEELQSTNEELTTSKEEMQSMNEELQTVNAEQRAKMDELARVSNDMKNLLNSTGIVTIFLDKELSVRRFTRGVNEVFKLIPSDIGRPLTDIASDLLYPELPAVAREVLDSLIFNERQVATADGRWFMVRILPYRTLEDKIDGVVMTFTNITAAKKIEAELRATTSMLRTIVHASTFTVICLAQDGKILEFNPVAEKLLGCRRDEVLHKNFFELFIPGPRGGQAATRLKKMLSADSGLNFTTPFETKTGETFSIQWSTGQMLDVDGQPAGIVALGQDLSVLLQVKG
ncbi:chemotaxis protein CheB [Geopsychrobacter electrodiphilus]|uniref:chemotaxis protein CheB n=1 Tax=Geopsychrobacter electrodiphilus TaxID=225196 RepID=UPI0003772B7A|nr:chemotaxis protein CheB [Geopsychrobacter electrodiphilus]